MTFKQIPIRSLESWRSLITTNKYSAMLLLYMIENSVDGYFANQSQKVIANKLNTHQPVISRAFLSLKENEMIVATEKGYKISPSVLIVEKETKAV
jgi:hypothetical protein